MPGYDRTGPEGKGSMTGRGLGRCSDPETKTRDDRGFNNENRGSWPGFRFRFGFGGGSGRGRGRRQGRGQW